MNTVEFIKKGIISITKKYNTIQAKYLSIDKDGLVFSEFIKFQSEFSILYALKIN